FGQQELHVYKGRVEVTVEGSSANWRGTVSVRLDMPAEVSYAIDLAAIEPKHLRWDKGRKLLKVTLLPPKLAAVSPLLDEMEVTARFGRARTSWTDGGVARDVERRLLKEDYRPAAREAAAEKLSEAKKAGCVVMREFLVKVLQAKDAEIEVLVE